MRSLSPVDFVKGLGGIVSGRPMNLPASLKDNPVLRTLFQRRSIRKFKQKAIPDDIFNVVLEAGRLAPSTVNLQTWTFGVFDQQQWKKTFNLMIPFKGTRAVIIMGDVHRSQAVLDDFPCKPLVEYTLSTVNAGIASYAMNIAAESMGIGSVMLSETGKSGFYDALYLKKKLGLADGVFPLMTIVFGYAAEKASAMPPKLPLSEIVFTEGVYKEPDRKVMEKWLKEMMAGYRAMFVIQSFKDRINHYLAKVDEAEKGLHKIVFYKKEEFRKKIR